MARRKPSTTWLEVGVRNAGFRTTLKAVNWAYCWAVTRESIGHDPTADEVAEWWAMSRRTAFREQKAFREAFPKLDDPAPMYDTPEQREALARDAALGDRIDKWADDRKARREEEAVRAALGNATTN